MPIKSEKTYLLERRYALVFSLLVSFVVIFGVACVVAYKSYTKAIDASIRSNETKAILLTKLILEHQRAAIGVLRSYAGRPLLVDSVKRKDFEGTLYHVTDLARNNPEMDWPFVANPDSTVWVNYPVDRQGMNKDLSYRDWYKGVCKEWRPYISSVYKLLVGEKDLAVAVSAPILDEDGKAIGILSTAQSAALFQKIIGETGINLDATITLLDQEGHIIYSNRCPYTKEIIDFPPFEFVKRAMKGEKGNVEVCDASDRDRIKYVSFAPVEGIGWSIIVEKPRNEVLWPEYSYLVLIGVISLLAYGVFVLFMIRSRERHSQIKQLEDRVRERTLELEAGNRALGESERRWATTLASIGDAVIATDLTGRITFMNKIAEELTGWIPAEAVGKPVGIVFHIINENTRNRVDDPIAKVLKEGVIVSLANHSVLVGKSAREIPIDDSGAPIRDHEGRLMGVVLVFRDITERRRAEQEAQKLLANIREEKDRLSALINSIRDEVWFADTEKNFTLANPSALHEFGLNGVTNIEVKGLAESLEVYRPDGTSRPLEEAPPLRALQGEVVTNQEETIRTPRTGVLRVREVSATPVKDAVGHIIGSVSVVRDITERKKAELELQQRTSELQSLTETLERRVKERTAELSDLTSRLVSLQENERRQVSYDLHDNVWQTLLAIRSEIERLFSKKDGMDWAALQEKSKKVMGAILETVEKIRSMQGDLWPYVLDDIGILATIDWYCREFEKNNPSLITEREYGLAENEISSSAKIVIYRILQESLSNVAKYSRASHVTLRLLKKDRVMEFTVEDNGIGFDPGETIAKKSAWGGLGLLSIKARTELSGGSFEVESVKAKGTTVRASWPLHGNGQTTMAQ